ncbi:aspartate aminotransferase family protein [Chengkuizengella sediminis]|uniref:aspartate aminotransferase family protein n=1 Tax=Chengkuizengella sediminis TaxID=1885917 RepID=UPI0013897439|nr:aspartate aminotransferase family protein [Chengkuizengella sediminis]NDI36041.1 aspartate aminotransferase family protein [Chengkuizengella sediminis]
MLLSQQTKRESNARSYPRRIPIAIREASGIFVKDVEGNSYIDCLGGAGTLALGHNHPVVVEAIQSFLSEGYPLHTLDITTPVKEQFVDELLASLPSSFARRAKIQFCGPSGADAVEAAIKLVKTATGNRSVFSFHGGYHGMTHGALSLMGNTSPKEKITGLMSDVHFLPFPYDYRCPFGLGGDLGISTGIHYIQNVLDDPESGIVSPSGMIMEVVQGEGGAIPAPNEWMREIRRLTKERNIPLIIDEVQTGIGRTGAMYAFEHADITPDVVILSKAIGGSLPLSVVLYDESLDRWEPGAHAGTFRGNQMAMATGIATLQFVLKNKLDVHAEKMGDLFMSNLRKIQHEYSSIGEVRGRGLMIGLEIVNCNKPADQLGAYPSNPDKARFIQAECFRRGLIVELGGRHGSVIRFLPPLIVNEEQIEQICSIFYDAIQAADKQEMKLMQEV